MPTTDLVNLHELAVRSSVEVVESVRPEDLVRETPCSAWSLTDLLAHMTVQHDGFATAIRGHGPDLAAWEPRSLGAAPAAEYAAAVERVLEAFGERGVDERQLWLPEISAETTFPGALARGFHLVDYVTHGWDVAATLGVTYRQDPAVVDAALRVAELVPGGDNRLAPGASFAPGLPIGDDAPPLHRLLALLGRSPHWSPIGRSY
jgi:uncharacterized protein (TIGR03086 family)